MNKNEDDKWNNKYSNLRDATKKLKNEFKSGTPLTLKQALLIWSKSLWVDNPPNGLEQIAERLPELASGINKLNSILYAENKNKYTIEELQKEFNDVKFVIKKKNNSNDSYLTNLYPEKK